MKILDDCNYNCVKQFSKQLELLWNLDGYIKDARECGHKDCQEVFEAMQKDAEKHAKVLKGIIEKKIKEEDFN